MWDNVKKMGDLYGTVKEGITQARAQASKQCSTYFLTSLLPYSRTQLPAYHLTCTAQSSDTRKAARYTAEAVVEYSLRHTPSIEGQDNTTAIVIVVGAEAAAAAAAAAGSNPLS